MANTMTSLYQTLVSAVADAVGDGPAAVRVGNLQAVKSVYLDYDAEEPGNIFQTLNIALPASQLSNVTDIGAGDFVSNDITPTLKTVTLDQHPALSYVIRNVEQANSPAKMRTLFLDGYLKGIYSSINAAITAKFTTGNFNVNTNVSTTGGIITTTQFLGARASLAASNVPLSDPTDISFLVSPVPYSKILGDSSWTDESKAGINLAEEVREQGVLKVAYGFGLREEQQMSVTGSVGTRTFIGAAFHRHAIALVARRMPEPTSPNVVDYIDFDFNGIPVRVMMGWNHIKNGTFVSVEALYGLTVVRPDHGVIFTTAE